METEARRSPPPPPRPPPPPSPSSIGPLSRREALIGALGLLVGAAGTNFYFQQRDSGSAEALLDAILDDDAILDVLESSVLARDSERQLDEGLEEIGELEEMDKEMKELINLAGEEGEESSKS